MLIAYILLAFLCIHRIIVTSGAGLIGSNSIFHMLAALIRVCF